MLKAEPIIIIIIVQPCWLNLMSNLVSFSQARIWHQ